MPEHATAEAFDWVPYLWGEALRCRPLGEVADHCFTTRRPVLQSSDSVAGDGWHNIATAFGVAPNAVVRLRQVHGAGVVAVRAADATLASAGERAAADAMVTGNPDVLLSVAVADCIPLLMGDGRTGAVAAVHAGWRGAAAGVAAAAVRKLGSLFSTDPADLIAAIGPSIGPCCYRVGPELRDQFLAAGQSGPAVDRWFAASPSIVSVRGVPGSEPSSPDGRSPLWLNMWSVVSDQLMLAGLKADHVHVARLCTSCGRDVFHSFRVDGAKAGRMVGVIRASSLAPRPSLCSPARRPPRSPLV